MADGLMKVMDASEHALWELPEVPGRGELPGRLLYATSARLGGSGLDVTSLEGALAAERGGFLGRVLAYADGQREIAGRKVRTLPLQPARLLSFLGSERYYGAKKQWLDRVAAWELGRGEYDFLHTWSGDGWRSLVAAAERGIPSVMDIPTWHRNKGQHKRFETKTEREMRARVGWRARLDQLPPSRQRVLLEYDLADFILVQSTYAAETFVAAGIPAGKIIIVARGADVEKFTPASAPPPVFRAVFAGALIRRKGVHHLLEAWQSLGLKEAELWLVGSVHAEVEAALRASGEFSDVAVIGVPDAEWGEIVVACYPAGGREPDLVRAVAGLHGAMKPKRFLAVADWPRAAQGKINRAQLKTLALK
jgi:glycosyltransferase involved in cell wall biosynthesis